MTRTKIGWKEFVRSTSETGASRYANANTTFPSMYNPSFSALSDRIAFELFRIANKK